MAEDLTKEILPIEEQKQEKKLLYKNWKIYATALGIITVGLAVGLGIGLGVQNSSHNTVSTEQKIVNEINSATTTYTLPTITNVTAVSITNQITSDFIKTKLTGNSATAFNVKSFKLNSITIGDDNHVLANSDLITAGTINAKINYDYASVINQTTNLTITITTKENSPEIVNQINNTTYETSVEINSTVNDLIIMPLFINQQLKFQYKTEFDANLFKFNQITINDQDLQDSNLTTTGTINAKINYDYDSITNQTTNLTITVGTDVWSNDAIINYLKQLSSFTVNYDKTSATITTIEAKLKDMYLNTFTSIKVQDEIKANLTISNLNRAISGVHTPWTDDDLRSGATSGTTWYNLTFKDTLISSSKIGYLTPIIFDDQNIIDSLTKLNSSSKITYDKTIVTLDAIKAEMINTLANSITDQETQNYLKTNLTIARLYTSARVDGETVQTDVTNERLKNGETTGDYDYLLTKYTLSLNEIESKVLTLRLFPNNN